MVADGRLLDLIRRIYCFGMSLLKLDLRQESTRHADAVDAITTHLGYGRWDGAGVLVGGLCVWGRVPLLAVVLALALDAARTNPYRSPQPRPPHTHTHSYKEWDEARKLEWLTEELTTKRPLVPAEMPMTDEVGAVGVG